MGKRGTVLCLPIFYCIVTIGALFESYLRWIVFSPNTRKYGPEKTLYSDSFHAVLVMCN